MINEVQGVTTDFEVWKFMLKSAGKWNAFIESQKETIISLGFDGYTNLPRLEMPDGKEIFPIPYMVDENLVSDINKYRDCMKQRIILWKIVRSDSGLFSEKYVNLWIYLLPNELI